MAGAVLAQSSAAALLTSSDSPIVASSSVLKLFLWLAVIQLALVLWWWRIIEARKQEDLSEIEYGLLPASEGDALEERELAARRSRRQGEKRRGRWALGGGIGVIFSSWVVFFLTLSQ